MVGNWQNWRIASDHHLIGELGELRDHTAPTLHTADELCEVPSGRLVGCRCSDMNYEHRFFEHAKRLTAQRWPPLPAAARIDERTNADGAFVAVAGPRLTVVGPFCGGRGEKILRGGGR